MPLPLPSLPRRNDLRAFWLTMSSVAAIAITAALVRLTLSRAFLLAAPPLAGIFIAAGWHASGFVEQVYHAWNRLAVVACRLTRGGATVSGYAIVTAVGWLGSPLPWNAPYPPGSGWTRRASPEAGSFTSASRFTGDAQGTHWLLALLQSTRRAGGSWVWALVPALALLAIVEAPARRNRERGTYTLY
jgi:hypothetical protein